jgi:hypothetical protein
MDEHQADAFIGECLNVFFLCIPREKEFDPALAMNKVFEHVSAEGINAADLEQLRNYCRESIPAALEEDDILHFHHNKAVLTLQGKGVWDSLNGSEKDE